MRLLRHQCGLVEAGKNKLELAGIQIDVAARENARNAGFEACRFDRDELVVAQLYSPICHRSKLHGESKERQYRIAGNLECGAVICLHHRLADLTIGSSESRDLSKHKIDFALADQLHHFVDAVGCGAKFAATVQQSEVAGARCKIERPIERAIAAADDQHSFTAEHFHFAYSIKDRFAFISLDAGNRRPLRLKRPAAGCDDHELALELRALIRRYPK